MLSKVGDNTNKIAAALVIIFFAMVLVSISTESVLANFKPYTSPSLTVLSPSPNKTYTSSDIPLNVTVQLFGWYLGADLNKEELNWLNYSLDGHAGSEIPVTSVPGNYFPNPVFNGTGNVMLSGLSEGRHWIEVYGATSFNTTFSTGLIFFTVNAQPFSMPEEQVNYTITQVDGTLWAKIDGTYPIAYSGDETSIPMIYPIPPGTINISVWMNDSKLSWSNFTESNSEALHYTTIGDWQEILTVLENVSGGFVLRIHYEHPLQIVNGSYAFLYDLNIQEYLSAVYNSSVAHFTIAMDVNYSNLKVNTVDPETETLKPIEYATHGDKNVTIKIDEVSEFGKTLLGDLLISFSSAKMSNNIGLSVVPAAAFVVVLISFGIGGYVLLHRRRKQPRGAEGS